MPRSNDTGRYLEYLIVRELIEQFNCLPTESTIKMQERDKEKVDIYSPSILLELNEAIDHTCKWISKKITLQGSDIERLGDASGKKGDVTDFRIINDENSLNISLKHNHNALKHQRPSGTIQHLGFKKNTTPDREFRYTYKKILNDFENYVNKNYATVTLYKNVSNIVPDMLYDPMCKLVLKFYERYSNDPKIVDKLFRFLIGNTNYYKIIIKGKSVTIKKYYDLKNPTSMKVLQTDKSYLNVYFNNQISVRMRLHTASSRIAERSLKFDTQPLVFDVPTEEFHL